jgi:hypothetical protein
MQKAWFGLGYFLVFFTVFALVAGCASDREFARTGQGAAIGGAIGYGIGGKKGAIIGGLLGGAGGSVLGIWEVDRGRPIGGRQSSGEYPSSSGSASTPRGHLDFLYGAMVGIKMTGWANNAAARSIIVDGLRRWGATVIADGQGEYIAEVQVEQQGQYAFVNILILTKGGREIMAQGTGEAQFYYDGSDQYRSYQWAARRAVASLR